MSGRRVFDGIQRWLADARRTFRGSTLCFDGANLVHADRFADAVPLLREAMELLGTPREDAPALYGFKSATLLIATTELATAAAHVGDRALAVSAIHQGMPIVTRWKTNSPDESPARAHYDEWERWATRYLASVSTGPPS